MEWISVNERLPEQSGNVLICTDKGYVSVVAFSAKYSAFNHYDMLGEPGAESNVFNDVAYWMPISALPEEVRRDA